MESIYKIKVRSDLSPQDLYPSERRYSSSIVLGLSVLFLALTLTSALMGTLVVQRITVTNFNNNNENQTINNNITDEFVQQNATEFTLESADQIQTTTIGTECANCLENKIEKELTFQFKSSQGINYTALSSGGCFVMALGHFLAGLTGLMAWKCWYMDSNIAWFFLTSSFSIMTSTISLLIILCMMVEIKEDFSNRFFNDMSLGLIANILITSIMGVIWSILASKVAYKGMKNNYPEDMVLSKGYKGKVEVNMVKKGNKIANVVTPDILDHFPKSGKLAKHLPKKNGLDCLPKAESNKEYEERVKKFLTEGRRTQEAETDD